MKYPRYGFIISEQLGTNRGQRMDERTGPGELVETEEIP